MMGWKISATSNTPDIAAYTTSWWTPSRHWALIVSLTRNPASGSKEPAEQTGDRPCFSNSFLRQVFYSRLQVFNRWRPVMLFISKFQFLIKRNSSNYQQKGLKIEARLNLYSIKWQILKYIFCGNLLQYLWCNIKKKYLCRIIICSKIV